MSLTSLLNKDPNVIKLFNCLPDDTHFLRHYTPESNYRNNRLIPVAPRPRFAEPATVGTAYDFWLRSFIQRLNNFHDEKELPAQVLLGLKIIDEEHFLGKKDLVKLIETVENIWSMRNDYIKGKDVDLHSLMKGCLILSYCERAMRSREKIKGSYFEASSANINDLIRMAHANQRVPRLFKTDKDIYLNPTFGDYSKLVGGADADFVLGDTLVDIKTSIYPSFTFDFLKQLIGYYCLSTMDRTFKYPIRHIGIFYPRFNRFSFFSIQYLEHYIDLELFTIYFEDILRGDSDSPVFRYSNEQLKKALRFA